MLTIEIIEARIVTNNFVFVSVNGTPVIKGPITDIINVQTITIANTETIMSTGCQLSSFPRLILTIFTERVSMRKPSFKTFLLVMVVNSLMEWISHC